MRPAGQSGQCEAGLDWPPEDTVCRNGRQLDLGESKSPTQIFQRNLVLASHGLWAYVSALEPGLIVMMAMVMMAMVMTAMVMVSVMVIIVPVALRQLGWLRQR